jgi:aryl-alcohol dehydrogenase-like predicted oxidoreductase
MAKGLPSAPMEMRPFGRTGMRVSALGFGAAEIGFENTSDVIVDAMLGEALDCGLNVIDTAAMYETSEAKIGRALRGRRDQFLLFTKCGRKLAPRSTVAGFLPRLRGKLERAMGGAEERVSPDWHPRSLRWNIDQSLIRLQTDRIDLIQLHSCSEEILRRGDAIEVLERARDAGKVRHIGYSGDGPTALHAIQCGHFEALQTSISIADQEALDLTLPLASAQGMGLIAKRPIANALWRNPHRPEAVHLQAYWDRLQELCYDFLGGPRAAEIALRFTLSVAGVSTVIAGTTNVEHFRGNLKFATDGVLSDGEFDSIRSRWKEIARSDWVGQM